MSSGREPSQSMKIYLYHLLINSYFALSSFIHFILIRSFQISCQKCWFYTNFMRFSSKFFLPTNKTEVNWTAVECSTCPTSIKWMLLYTDKGSNASSSCAISICKLMKSLIALLWTMTSTLWYPWTPSLISCQTSERWTKTSMASGVSCARVHGLVLGWLETQPQLWIKGCSSCSRSLCLVIIHPLFCMAPFF